MREYSLPVRCQNYAAPLVADLAQGFPEQSFGDGVHACGWLIQEHDGGVTNQSYGGAQLALITSAV